MIEHEEIKGLLKKYERDKISIATICSHSALQIFHGARREGFRTIGITTEDRKIAYDAFPLARPDEYIVVRSFSDIMKEEVQGELRRRNAIVVPHGSFVEYVGLKDLEDSFLVPMFGNRRALEWEGDRRRQREWLERAGLRLPRELPGPDKITGKAFVKFGGAKGGKNFFTASSEREFYNKLEELKRRGRISGEDERTLVIQEFVCGVRYYIHYFYSPINGRLELFGMDKRIEVIDEAYRGLPDVPEEFFDYTVTGNQPVILRESLLPSVIKMGYDVVKASQELFYPGLIGPFCLETMFHPDKGFIVFEISARIVAGTNLYPSGSPYTCYIFDEPMSTGRRIAREIKVAIERDLLEKVVY